MLSSPVKAQDISELPGYVIQPGDSLEEIAVKFGVSISDLIQINNIPNPDFISPGQILKIPGLTGISGTITPVVVGLGESAARLLIKYQADSTALIKINRITNLSEIYAGSNILIPIVETTKKISPVAILEQNMTELEEAVFLNANPYELLILNQKPADYFVFSGDLLFKILLPGEKPLHQLSASIEEINVNPLPLKQGATATIRVKTDLPLTLEGQINGHKLNFFTTDNKNYYALQGINAMATPGLTEFRLTGIDGTKTVFLYEQNILLAPVIFETDPPLSVDLEKIDPKLTKPEDELIFSLTSQVIPKKYWEGIFISPAFYQEYTSFFGNRRTYNNNPEVTYHTGVDFGGGMGLPIVAPAHGKVVYTGSLSVRGNVTIIDHGLGVFSGYFHQSKIDVKVGDFVTKGQKIGEVGNSGRVNGADEFQGAGAHLHWELWVNGVQVNPLDWLNTAYP